VRAHVPFVRQCLLAVEERLAHLLKIFWCHCCSPLLSLQSAHLRQDVAVFILVGPPVH
jgi:hypothetical protein